MLRELAEEAGDESELASVAAALDEVEKSVEAMEFARMLSGENDRASAFLDINAGAGGTESMDWAAMLLRMYTRYCEQRGWKVEINDYVPGEEAGVKNVSIQIEGEFAYGYLKAENGVHRLVRISPFDANKRRHTSFASLDVIAEIEDEDEVGDRVACQRRARPGPKPRAGEPATERVEIRVTTAERESWDEARGDTSLSEWIRRRCNQEGKT